MIRGMTDLDTITVRIPMTFERRGGRKLIIGPDGADPAPSKPDIDETLIRGLVKAHCWRSRIESGKARSITDLAAQEDVSESYVCRILALTCLAPDIVEAILDGRQPKGIKLAALLPRLPLDWPGQRRMVGTCTPGE